MKNVQQNDKYIVDDKLGKDIQNAKKYFVLRKFTFSTLD